MGARRGRAIRSAIARPTRRLLRHCSVDDLAGREIDEPTAEMLRALAEATHTAGTVLRVVGIGTGVNVDEMVFEGAIDQDGELARCGGDGFGFADAERHPAIERA